MNLPLKKYSSIFWTLGFLILSANTFAQSSYYWTQNFNTESSLLAGAVVGGNAGASAVYYNPALINQKESNKLALSANLVSLKSMKLDNLAGTGADYRALKLQFQPKFISYTGVSKKDSKLIYELAFLVPLHLDVEYNFVSNQNLDIIKRLDGNEDYLGELNFKNAYDDYYVGGGVSYRLSDRISVGGSVFISYKQMDYAAGLDLKALQNSDTVYSNGAPEPFYIAQNSYSEKLEYTDVSLVTKLGVHYNSPNGRWGFGLNLTLSNLRVYGSGDVQKEFYRSNVYDDSEDEFTKDLAFTNIQEEIKTQIKDPLSLAFGFQYRSPNENHSIFFTTEYFFAIDKYAMLETIEPALTKAENDGLMMTHCANCHSASPTHPGFATAPGGLYFVDQEDLLRQKARAASAIGSGYMPLGNMTKLSRAERARLMRYLITSEAKDGA